MMLLQILCCFGDYVNPVQVWATAAAAAGTVGGNKVL
jgi:hypothetical protein